jgi:hypothetical protein
VFLWGNTKLVVKGVMPNFLHVIPVSDDTVFDGIFEGENTTFGLSFVADSIFGSVTLVGNELDLRTQHMSPSGPYQPSHLDDEGDLRLS